MKRIVLFILLLLFFVLPVENVNAGLVTVNSEGGVVVNVLAYSSKLSLEISEQSDIYINKIGDEDNFEENVLSLYKEGDQVNLKISGADETKELNVTGWESEIIEIEEREDTKKIRILLLDEKFAIEQSGFIATTEYPIDVDPEKNHLSLITPTGSVHLSVLPVEAAETLLKSKSITTVTSAALVEKEAGKLIYEISGDKTINIFNIIDYTVPVSAQVSVLTGEILFIDQPVWLRAISILLDQ